LRKPKPKTTKPHVRTQTRDERALDWTPLYQMIDDAIEWAIDDAARYAAPYPEEAEAVENVRAFVSAKRHGRPAQVRTTDVLLVFSIILAAIERDLTPHERELFAALEGAIGIPHPASVVRVSATPHRCGYPASCNPPPPPPPPPFCVPYFRTA